MANQQPQRKPGQVPIKSKGKNIGEFYLGAPKSDFDVPDECVKELNEKQFAYRWIDIQQLKKSGNQHKQNWVPHKFKCLSGTAAKNPFLDASLDGFLVRNGMVLAAKTLEDHERQKGYVRRRTMLQSNAGKKAADEFREFVRDEKSMKVHEWDETDEKET